MSQPAYYIDSKEYLETKQNNDKTPYLITGFMDTFLMGGASILFFSLQSFSSRSLVTLILQSWYFC